MIFAASFSSLLAFWVFVAWRVRVERGVVHRPLTAFERLARACVTFQRLIGLALLPAVATASRQMREWADAFADAVADAEDAAAANLDLPDGYTVAFDTRPLLEPKGDPRP